MKTQKKNTLKYNSLEEMLAQFKEPEPNQLMAFVRNLKIHEMVSYLKNKVASLIY